MQELMSAARKIFLFCVPLGKNSVDAAARSNGGVADRRARMR